MVDDKGETTAKSKAQNQPSTITDVQNTIPRSLHDQARHGKEATTDEFQDLTQEDVLETLSSSLADLRELHDLSPSSRLPSTISSDGGIQLHNPEDIPNTVADNTQVCSSSPLQQSYEMRYSPPNVSAISSSLGSPVTQSFQRPRHPRSQSPADAFDGLVQRDDKPDREMPQEQEHETTPVNHPWRKTDALWSPIYYGKDDDADGWDLDIELEQSNQASSDQPKNSTDAAVNGIVEESPLNDDAEGVMNPQFEGVNGFVVPQVEGITSVDGKQLDQILSDGMGHHADLPPCYGIASQSLPTNSFVRRASSPTGRPMLSLASPSIVDANVHIKFTKNTPMQDTPFTKTLKYFKQIKDKENTPSKSRRNASLPEEIAELAKEAQQEGIENEQEMWDKYREIDFAPLDPVMDDGLAGDLIMTGTPAKMTVTTSERDKNSPLKYSNKVAKLGKEGEIKGHSRKDAEDALVPSPFSLSDNVIKGLPSNDGVMYEVSIPGHYDDAFQLRFRSKASTEHTASFIRERGEALEANKEDIDCVVEKFLQCPKNFRIWGSDADDPNFELTSQNDKQISRSGPNHADNNYEEHGNVEDEFDNGQHKRLIIYEDPVFVKVIGMLPKAMFWVVAIPVVHVSSKALETTGKAFDKALRKLTSMSSDESHTST